MYRVGIDVGGTFTDLVAIDDAGRVTLVKSASTPADPSVGVMEGLGLLAEELGQDLPRLLSETERIVHGTTVATNALVERKGARVGLLTTEGHRDILEMREGLKEDRYNLRVPPPVPLVPRGLRLGVRERIRFDGTVDVPLSQASLADAIHRLQQAGVDAVAICYLHAYRNPRHEIATRRAVAKHMRQAYVSASWEVLPRIKEYERICTTVVNAYVGPALAVYLRRLAAHLAAGGYRREILIMQSHGGVAEMRDSVRLAAGAILSGPAGGIAGSRYCARLLAEDNFITFDMGGTSTDIALLQAGEPPLTDDKVVGGHKVALPSIDIHTLGAGGGSIARVDAGGILHVGPDSAGADPGPACYSRGGETPTVTDANVVLGFLDPANFLGGRVRIDPQAATRVVAAVAARIGCSVVDAAQGIHRIVNTNMAEGIQIVSVRRGIDPRRFAVLAFGGAAGLHITEVARMLEMTRVVVPRIAAVLSAWGMLATDLRYELVRTHAGDVQRVKTSGLRRLFAEMEAEGRKRLEKTFAGPIRVRRSVDMRYGEQIFEISVPLDGMKLDSPDLIDRLVEQFRVRHEELYSYSALDQDVVLVNARLAVEGVLSVLPQEPPVVSRGAAVSPRRRRVFLGTWEEVPIYNWETLLAGREVPGPAVVESATTTVVIRQGDRALVTPHGWLDIRVGKAP